MKQSYYVFRLQLSLFRREKGMHLFYIISIAIVGIIIPFFLHNIKSTLPMAFLLTLMFLKPILSYSLAGEHENKTLEALLSTSSSGKNVLRGKISFCLLFAIGFFTITTGCTIMTNLLSAHEMNMNLWQWLSIILLALLNFGAICITCVYKSATSEDLRNANNIISRISYPMGLLYIVYLSVLFLMQLHTTLVAGFALMLICISVILIYTAKVSKMKQSDFFENIKSRKYEKMNNIKYSYIMLKSQFSIVFKHELMYLFTLKTLLLNFLFLCLSPTIITCILANSTGKINLNYSVLVTALMIPRVPTNLIAYSIGGEKAYKTGESLLSTPLHTRPVFLAKCIIPIVVSVVMLILSASVTLIGVNVIGRFIPGKILTKYTLEQLVLLFPVSILSSIAMVFITGVLSVTMKTPRQGLYISSTLGVLFVIPPLVIMYLMKNSLLSSVVYSILLLLCNSIFVICISDKITRPFIISKL